VTVALRVPVVERVSLQFTQGVPPLRFETAVWVATPVNLKVKEQSGVCAYATCGLMGPWWPVKIQSATMARRVKGRTLRNVVMSHIVDLEEGTVEGVQANSQYRIDQTSCRTLLYALP
jgi:hypothetical protein